MRKRISLNEPDLVNSQEIIPSIKSAGSSGDMVEIRPVKEILIGEGREDFVNYIEWLGLENDPNLIVISSMHHYFYDAEEMIKVNILVNLIKLNQIKDIKDFLVSISHNLSSNSNFIGCFVDNKSQDLFELRKTASEDESKRISTAVENGILSRIPLLNRIYSFVDSRTNRYLTKHHVTLLLEDHGFKVLDMTEMNGLTYFHAKKKSGPLKTS